MNREPWPDRYIAQRRPSEQQVRAFQRVLDDAEDEGPLQVALAANPALMLPLTPLAVDAWWWDRPRLGAEFVPDFLLCRRNSGGLSWTLVEIESPTKATLTAKGLPSAALNTALGQVRDWRVWLRDNIAYAQGQLGFEGIDAECPAWVVLGRRANLNPKHMKQYRELSAGNTSIMTFDRLVEAAHAGGLEEGTA